MFKVHTHSEGATYKLLGRNVCYRKDYHSGKLRNYTIIFKAFGKSYNINIQVADF